MQTFLPYPDFAKSAECLDKKRCWKQCVEAYCLINVIKEIQREDTKKYERNRVPWENHPACRMWRPYLNALIYYYNVFWIESTQVRGIKAEKLKYIHLGQEDIIVMPRWLGDERVHSSHRSNLLRKKPEFYGQYGWSESSDLAYFWPV